MSTAKKQNPNNQVRNFSFANLNEDLTFNNINITDHRSYTKQISPSKPNKYSHQYESERENIAPNNPNYNQLPSSQSPIIINNNIHTVDFLEQQVRRLEEVIFYVGTNNDKLIIQCDDQQKQIAFLKICNQRGKQESEVEIRKLKQMLKDKISENETLVRNGKREKQAFEQQSERLNVHIKSIIEKKNDQIFSITSSKERQIRQAQKGLENTIDQIKFSQKKEVQSLNIAIDRLNEEVQHWQDKFKNIQQQYKQFENTFQAEKIRIIQQNEGNLHDLKTKYNRYKSLLRESNQQEMKALQEGSELQRDSFLLEIKQLRLQISRLQQQNRQYQNIIDINKNNNELTLADYQKSVSELQEKLYKIHKQKEQQIQMLKIKTGVLNDENIKSVQSLYQPKIQYFSSKLQSLQDQIQRLQQALDKQMQKNRHLINQMKRKDSQNQQQLSKLKLMYSNAQESLKHKYESQKSMILQQSAQVIKNFEMKANNILFYEQQLRKLRILFDDKTKECENNQAATIQLKQQWNKERLQLNDQIKKLTSYLQDSKNDRKKENNEHSKEIQRLNQQILIAIRNGPVPDYSKFQIQIQELKNKLNEKTYSEAVWKEKYDQNEKKCRQYREQSQKLHFQSEIIINQAKSQWEHLTDIKMKQTQQFFNKKLTYLDNQNNQLKVINNQLQNKICHLVNQYKELENTLADTMNSLRKKSQFEQKILMLGMDNNLVKNKQQLFEY